MRSQEAFLPTLGCDHANRLRDAPIDGVMDAVLAHLLGLLGDSLHDVVKLAIVSGVVWFVNRFRKSKERHRRSTRRASRARAPRVVLHRWPCEHRPVERSVEAWFDSPEDHPVAAELFRRWRRNRDLFDRANGLGIGRDVERHLRDETERARHRLEDADRRWHDAGSPERGRHARRFAKARMTFLQAVHAENAEYEGTLVYREIDPDDDDAISAFLEAYESEG